MNTDQLSNLYNIMHVAMLTYERAVREQVGVEAARTIYLDAMRAWEQASEGRPDPQCNEPW